MIHAAGKTGFGFVLAALVLVFGIEEWAMRGTIIYREVYDSPASGSAAFQLKPAPDLYTVELETTGRIALKWSLSDPYGNTIASDYESTPDSGVREISFKPKYLGTYRLEFGKERQRHQAPGTAEVRVRSGDRRLSKRLKALRASEN